MSAGVEIGWVQVSRPIWALICLNEKLGKTSKNATPKLNSSSAPGHAAHTDSQHVPVRVWSRSIADANFGRLHTCANVYIEISNVCTKLEVGATLYVQTLSSLVA